MAKRNYINPKIIEGTMHVLHEYLAANATTKTPMADCMKSKKIQENDRPRFVRAAQRLGWPVVRSQGHVYENGVLLW